jgi:hypothetical protein
MYRIFLHATTRFRQLLLLLVLCFFALPALASEDKETSSQKSEISNAVDTYCGGKMDEKEKKIVPFETNSSNEVYLNSVLKEWSQKDQCVENSKDARARVNTLSTHRELLAHISVNSPLPFHSPEEDGICYMAYDAIQNSYKKYFEWKRENCHQFNQLLGNAISCGVNSNCKGKWRAIALKAAQMKQGVDSYYKQIPDFLGRIELGLRQAQKDYQIDWDSIRKNQSALPPETANRVANGSDATESLCKDANPQNGGKVTCDDYIKKLTKTENVRALFQPSNQATDFTSGPLIVEEDNASKKIAKFNAGFKEVLLTWNNALGKIEEDATSISERIANGGGDDGIMNPLLKNPSNVAGLAGPASSLITGRGGDISGASALPALTGLAAAGVTAGAAMSKSNFTGASAAPGMSGNNPEAGAASPNSVGASPTGGTVFGGDLGNGKSDPGRSPASPFATANNNTQPTTDGVKTMDPATYTPNGSSAGASRPLTGKTALPSKTDNTAAPAMATDAGKKDDMLGGFSTSLDPRNSKPPTSVGGEVASLLGQMKNLFNLDEAGGPGPGGPGMGGPGGGPAGPAGSEGAPGAELAGTPDGGPAAQEAAAPDPKHASQGSEAAETHFGSLDKSLFARIRYRHIRCMEKGLLLYGLRERVE